MTALCVKRLKNRSIQDEIFLTTELAVLPDSALLGYSAHTGHVLPEGLLKARPGIHAQLSLETVAHLGRCQTQKGRLWCDTLVVAWCVTLTLTQP